MSPFCCPKAQSSIKLTMRLTYPFHTIRQGFHTNKLKNINFICDYCFYSLSLHLLQQLMSCKTCRMGYKMVITNDTTKDLF